MAASTGNKKKALRLLYKPYELGKNREKYNLRYFNKTFENISKFRNYLEICSIFLQSDINKNFNKNNIKRLLLWQIQD